MDLLHNQPLWYKDAVIYELHVRSFHDSDDDGLGDFRGLTQRLDYLQDLGVTAVWLLPFYPSPLKDDGYDIADYCRIHPNYGLLEDFDEFVREAHRRGIRVITELVLNHTSDQHPWFQRARRAAPGTPERDFYLWSESPGEAGGPKRYREARIIFPDFEQSNWAWDPVAKAYYWHRFYSHQPDLNYDNPAVREAILPIVDFWLERGVDGLRLDAVPYLFEREGTDCENLPETYAFLRQLRRHVDERFSDRMLLAEANQWPEDAAAYFGAGDECHMAFHFPLMPRLFMAVQMEDRFPILDIMAQTPPIPDNCQWALFLRNHDELTLEMVTDEERDYMNRVYARDPQARVNLGIRRRLAPLMGNHRRRIELMNALLFSFPGTPVIYYGDEIGMGDNIYLGDRHGVRTPMQWSAGQNAGFSRGNPQSLFLPPIVDPEFHYKAINVEAQRENSHSLLSWMKRLLSIRQRSRAFGRGTIEFLRPPNQKILAFIRRYREEEILAVFNLSRFAQHTELDLGSRAGTTPVEMFGRVEFPRIGTDPYSIMMGPHAFQWFTLEREQAVSMPQGEGDEITLPVLKVSRNWDEVLDREQRPALEEALKPYLMRLQEREDFSIQYVEVREAIAIPMTDSTAYLTLVEAEPVDGLRETYLVPLAFARNARAEHIRKARRDTLVATVKGGADGVIYDAVEEPDFCESLLNAIAEEQVLAGRYGTVRALRTGAFDELRGPPGARLEPSTLKVKQANTSVVYGRRLILKLFRKLEEGTHPDLDIGLYLTEENQFPHVPPVAGSLAYHRPRREPISLAIMHGYVPNEGDAWKHTLAALATYYRQAGSDGQLPDAGRTDRTLLELSKQTVPDAVSQAIGSYLDSAERIGLRTAQLHRTLARGRGRPDFRPEPFSALYQRSLYQSIRSQTGHTLRLLSDRLDSLPEEPRKLAKMLLDREKEVQQGQSRLLEHRVDAQRTRRHGDYHLRQLLYTGEDFVIIDFEGHSYRFLTTRRTKEPPLQDVVEMLWSFHDAAHVALNDSWRVEGGEAALDAVSLRSWLALWYRWVGATFLRGYLDEARQGQFLPQADEQLEILLDALLLHEGFRKLEQQLLCDLPSAPVTIEGLARLMGCKQNGEVEKY